MYTANQMAARERHSEALRDEKLDEVWEAMRIESILDGLQKRLTPDQYQIAHSFICGYAEDVADDQAMEEMRSI